MYEIRSVKQDNPEFKLRWFTSENSNADLYIWEKSNARQIMRFQFYYNRSQDEKVVEWTGANQLRFAGVDQGDFKNFYKAAPVLVHVEDVDLNEAFRNFQYYADELDDSIRIFVEERFNEGIHLSC